MERVAAGCSDIIGRNGDMEKKGDDRRVRRTREVLHGALISLMTEKSYESITIQEIIDRANVGRTTFYAHFSDKDDLVIWALQRLQEVLEDAREEPDSASEGTLEGLVGFALPAFQRLFDGRPIYKAIMGSQAKAIVMEYMPVVLGNLVRGKSRPRSRSYMKGDTEIPYDLLVHFVISTFVSLVSWWLDSPDPLPPKEIDTIFRALVLHDLRIGAKPR
jgi:AcrR family transcriptional regulator